MSLQVWLPLTKDTRQQGLSNISVTGTPASWGNGKLGKCATWNGAVANVLYNNTTDFNYTNNFSVAFWANPIYTGSTAQYAWTVGRADAGGYGYGFQIISATTAQFRFGNGSYGVSAPSNEWHHFAMTIGNSKVTIYKDGIQVGSNNLPGTIPTYSDGNGMGLGCFHYSGNIYPYYGSLNDFRIYDHCLSPMEVKELAKGLVLHYPLNREGWGQENQLKNSNFFNGTNSWYSVNSSSIRVETKDGYTCGTGTKGTSANIIGQTSAAYTGGTAVDITVSAKVYVTETGTFGVGHWISTTQVSGWQSMSGSRVWNTTNNLSVGWNYISTTLKNATNQYTGSIVTAFSYSGTTFWITDVKLEFGQTATPWCPNSSDVLATTMGLNSTTEYDCSGFCNNGEKIGTLTYTSDTPKYAVSTHMGSTSSKIHISNFPTSGFGNSYSFAWWGKNTAFSNKMFWGFSDGIRLNGMYSGVLWNTGDSSNNPLYKISTTTQVSAPSVNTWHHYVMTGNGTKCYVYLDGELWAEAKTYKAISGTSIYINGWGNTTDYCYDNMDISDFRIYATALSADDVKSLYQNSAYIDSSGNVYGAVHTEV